MNIFKSSEVNLKLISIFILILFCFLLRSSFFSGVVDYERIVDKITAQTAKKLQTEKKLYLMGTGGRMMHDIEMMAMSFNYYQEVDLNTSRELLMYAVNEYLTAINNNTEVRPYLHEYPFTAKNIKITIFIYQPDRQELPLEKIYRIKCINGKFQYYTHLDTYNPIHQETYDEALQRISMPEQVSK